MKGMLAVFVLVTLLAPSVDADQAGLLEWARDFSSLLCSMACFAYLAFMLGWRCWPGRQKDRKEGNVEVDGAA
ncbi:MAG: hypothetical protein GKR89_27115 [Candidatus Latescibacteria bacterium]|nr:hypothetical protein [Candidatus Latescibacterota bacterium]